MKYWYKKCNPQIDFTVQNIKKSKLFYFITEMILNNKLRQNILRGLMFVENKINFAQNNFS